MLTMQHERSGVELSLASHRLTLVSYLIIHDDLVGHSIEQRGLSDELFLGIFVFLFACLLDIVSCQCVQTGHLVLLMVSVVEVSIDTSRL